MKKVYLWWDTFKSYGIDRFDWPLDLYYLSRSVPVHQSHDWPPDNACLGRYQLIPNQHRCIKFELFYLNNTRWCSRRYQLNNHLMMPWFHSPWKLCLKVNVLFPWDNILINTTVLRLILISSLPRLFRIIGVRVSILPMIDVFFID